MAATSQRAPTTTFSQSLASMPNEIFSLIFEKLDDVDLVSVLTHVGLELFSRYIHLKRILPRLYRLRAIKCNNLIWDEKKLETSVFILWSLCRLQEEDSAAVKLPPEMYIDCDENSPSHLTVVAVKHQQTLSWNFSDTDNKMRIGNNDDGNIRCPIKTIYEFLNAKREWFNYEISICHYHSERQQPLTSLSLDTSTWKEDHYCMYLLDFSSPHMWTLMAPITNKIVCIIDEALKSGKFELIARPILMEGYNFFKIVLQPIVKMNFKFEPLSTVYQQLFPIIPSLTYPTPQWFSSTLLCADHLYKGIEEILKENARCRCEFIKSAEMYQSYSKIHETVVFLRDYYDHCDINFDRNCKGLNLALVKYITKPCDTIKNHYDDFTKQCCMTPTTVGLYDCTKILRNYDNK